MQSDIYNWQVDHTCGHLDPLGDIVELINAIAGNKSPLFKERQTRSVAAVRQISETIEPLLTAVSRCCGRGGGGAATQEVPGTRSNGRRACMRSRPTSPTCRGRTDSARRVPAESLSLG